MVVIIHEKQIDCELVDNAPKTLEQLFEIYTFLDGSPIGKIKD